MTAEDPGGSRSIPGRPLTEIVAVALGVTYVVGVLVVNSDLARFGLTSLDLARPEYVLAGVAALVLLLAAALLETAVFMMIAAGARIFERRRDTDWGRFARQLIGYFLLLLVLNTGLYFLVGRWDAASGWSQVRMDPTLQKLLVCAFPAMLTLGYANAFLTRGRRPFVEELWSVVLEPHRGADALVAIAFWAVAIFGYAILVYPDLPREFGGGRRPIVRLVVDNADALKSTGGIELATDNSTGPFLLVLETGDRYVVTASRSRLGKGSAKSTAIRKDLVRIVIYEGAER